MIVAQKLWLATELFEVRFCLQGGQLLLKLQYPFLQFFILVAIFNLSPESDQPKVSSPPGFRRPHAQALYESLGRLQGGFGRPGLGIAGDRSEVTG